MRPCVSVESIANALWPLPRFGTLNWGEAAGFGILAAAQWARTPEGRDIMANAAMKIPTAPAAPKARPGLTLGQAQVHAHQPTQVGERETYARAARATEPAYACTSPTLLRSIAQNGFQGGIEIKPNLRHTLIAILAKERGWFVIFKNSPALLILE